MNSFLIPEVLNDCFIYENGNMQPATGDVQLPKVENITQTLKGGGIAGEIESPTTGQYKSMQLTVNYRIPTIEFLKRHAPGVQKLEIRGANQYLNKNTSLHEHKEFKIVARGRTTTGDGGKMAAHSTYDSSITYELNYYKIMIDGKVLVEIDKFNYICVIDGIDYMKEIRAALGYE